jgi:hypothetical protein
MPSGFVGMDDAFADRAINNGNGFFVGGLRLRLIADLDGFEHFLDVGPHPSAHTRIVLTMLFGLLDPLFGLCRIRQGVFLLRCLLDCLKASAKWLISIDSLITKVKFDSNRPK